MAWRGLMLDKLSLFTALLALTAFPAFAQPAPKEQKGPRELCGLTAPDVGGIRTQVLAIPDIQAMEGSSLFESYSQVGSLHIWTFTKAGQAAHPAAVCRSIIQNAGGVAVDMKVVCDGPRRSCDTLLNDLESLNEKLKNQNE